MTNSVLIDDVTKLPHLNGVYAIKSDDMLIDISLNLDQKSDYLFVCFAGAKPLNKELPYFNRWKWGGIFNSSIVAISDYTLRHSKDLQIGWYQHDGEATNYDKLANFIKKLAHFLGYRDSQIILYGSSAGGFAALKCASYLPLAKCIAINAQTDISKYYKSYYDLLINHLKRHSVETESIHQHHGNVLLVQNLQDNFHYKNHYLPFLKKYPFSKKYEYSNENGHGAEPKEIIPYLIIKALEDENHLSSTAIDISFDQLEIANISQSNLVEEDKISFLPQGRKDLKPISIEFPIDWNIDPLKDKNWKFQLNMWRFWDRNLKEYSLTRDIDLIIPLRKVIHSWYEHHFLHQLPNEFLNEDMAIGGRAMRLAYYMVADSEYIESNPQYKSIVSQIVTHHVSQLLDFNHVAFSNHTLTDIHGLMALSKFLLPFPKQMVENFIDQIFRKLLSMQFSDDGFHKENSPEYHFFAIKCFEALKRSHWFEKYHLSEILNKAAQNKNIFYLPDGRILPFGDSSNSARLNEDEVVYDLAEPALYHHAGYLIYKENQEDRKVATASYFAIMAGLRSRFHKQNDNLSFIWFEGEDIIRDFGKFAYKRDKFRNYAVWTDSHNTLKFNTTNMYKGNLIQEDQFFESAIENYFINHGVLNVHAKIEYSAENIPKANIGITHIRHCHYHPQKSLLVRDEVSWTQDTQIEQYFHFAPQWVVQHIAKNSLLLRSQISGKCVKLDLDPLCDWDLFSGSIEPLQGWSSSNYAVAQPSISIVLKWQKGQDKAANFFKII